MNKRTDHLVHMTWLSLRNNRLKFKASGKAPSILEESMVEYTLNNKGNSIAEPNIFLLICTHTIEWHNPYLATPGHIRDPILKWCTHLSMSSDWRHPSISTRMFVVEF
jgi:hypothetical protein